MGAEALKEFLAVLGFKVDEAGAKRFNKSLAKATLRAAAFGATIQAAAGAAYAFLYKVAQGQSQLLDLADATGVAVGQLEELNFLAGQTGSSSDKLASSITNLDKSMGEATLGKGGLEAFRRLGIRITDSNGHLRDTVDVLFEVGEKIKDMDSGKQAMFLNQLGIDRSLVRMLTEDVGELRATYQEMYAASGMNAKEAAESSRKYVEEVNAIKAVLGMLAKSVALTFIGGMRDNLIRLRKAIVENFSKITLIFQTILKVVMRVAGAFGALTMRIMKWIGGIIAWFGRLGSGTQKLILGVLGFAAAWKFLNLSFMATPLGMFIALAAVIIGLIDDFQTWLEGGESLIDWGSDWGKVLGVVIGLVSALAAGFIAVPPIMGAISTAGTFLSGVLRAIGAAAAANPLGFFLTAAAMVATFVIAHWEKVKQWFSDFFGWLGDAVGWAVDLASGIAEGVGDAFDWVGDQAGALGDWMFGSDEDEAPARPAIGMTPEVAAFVPWADGGGGSTNMNQETNIYVNGAGDPAATGRAVAGEQNRVNADLVRNAQGAAQ